jgi:3-hydroxybutyryl-CoA dehydrogenase
MGHPERFLAIHWSEPAHVTRFLEIIPGKQTAQKYMEKVRDIAPAWGKDPAMLRSEIRGFITNRLSYAMYREACHLVDAGICTVEDVDRSMRNDVGWWSPFAGPFRYMDLMGVQAYHRVMKDLLPELNTSPEIPALIDNVVKSGGRGISNGCGFYKYTPKEAELWERRYTEFNYRLRRLLADYSEESFKPRKKKSPKK